MQKRAYLPGKIVTSFVVTVAAFCLVLLAGGGVFAEKDRPCADDVAKFCKGIQPGGGRIAKCLQENENNLSPACKERIAEVKEKIAEFRQACKDDVMNFCKDVKPGGGRILQCLKEHQNALSPECKAKMVEGAKEP